MRFHLETAVRKAALVAVVGLLATGCADNSWQAVRGRDAVPDYSKFLRANPNSPHAEEARQRIEFLRVQTHKSIKAYEEFASDYPNNPWLHDLRREMEPLYFDRARLGNGVADYRAFLASYPDGALTERARGNLIYVEKVRPAITVAALQDFLGDHPDSDFAEEAKATLGLIRFHRENQVQTMGVMVEVAPNVVQPQRVKKGFAAMVAKRYASMGITVVPMKRGGSPTPDMDAWVRIDYEESQASGVFGGSTLVSRARMRIHHAADADTPIWDFTFDAPAEHILAGSHGRDKTVFGNSRYPFWERFFIPVSTWATSRARVAHLDYLDEVAAVDIVGDRAALLFKRGGYDFMDVSTPTEPKTIGRYRREHDLSRWTGVRIATENLVLMYGPDGAEMIERTATKPRVVGRWELPEIGAVRSAQIYDKTALLASNRGVYAIRLEQRPLKPHRLLEGDFVGIQLKQPYIYLIRPSRVEVSSPKHLLRHITGSRAGLGKNFGATHTRLIGDRLFVFGKKEVAQLNLDRPGRPFVETRFDGTSLGTINDVTGDFGHLYVIGERGFQVTEPSGEWIADSIQVEASERMVRKGHYVFLVGGRSLEILDIGPYSVAAASIAPGN